MHVNFLDPYKPRPSFIHRLDPRVKFVLALVYILTVALIPSGEWAAYILLLAVVISIEILSELGVGYVLKRSSLALPFVLAAFPIIFTSKEGAILFQFTVGAWTLNVYQVGLEQFLSIGLKSWLSVQMAIVLSASTTFPDLLVAMRAVHIPRQIVSIFGLMWRYMFVLVDEALRLMRARTARSSQSDQPELKTGGSLVWRGRVAGGMAGSLILRGIERSDRIYMAMLARGYDGEVHSIPLQPLNTQNWLTLGIGLALFLSLLGLAYLF